MSNKSGRLTVGDFGGIVKKEIGENCASTILLYDLDTAQKAAVAELSKRELSLREMTGKMAKEFSKPHGLPSEEPEEPKDMREFMELVDRKRLEFVY